MNKSSILQVKSQLTRSIGNSQDSISRFAQFMGKSGKRIDGRTPSQATMNKARKFARNFSSGGSGKLNKLLLGSAIILPFVLGSALKAKQVNANEILNNEYGGDEDLMKKDLDEERSQLGKKQDELNKTIDGKEDALRDSKAQVNQAKPKEENLEGGDSDKELTTQEKGDIALLKRNKEELNLDVYGDAVKRFKFLVDKGYLFGQKETIVDKVINFVKNTYKITTEVVNKVSEFVNNSQLAESLRTTIGSEKGDGYIGPKWMGIKNPFHQKSEDEVKEKVLPVRVTKAQPVQTMTGNVVQPINYSLPADVAADEEFMAGINMLSEKYNMPPENFLAVMDFETGGTFDPAQKNIYGSGATGLIQFLPSTAESLGTTTGELAGMSRAEQIKYIDEYLETNLAGRLDGKQGDLSDLYMSILFPRAVGKSDDFVLFGEGASEEKFIGRYEANKGLDLNNDGSITKKEAASKIMMKKESKTDVSSIETPKRGVEIPSEYMSYDDPSGNGDGGAPVQVIVPVPPNSAAANPVMSQHSVEQDSPLIIATDPGAVASLLQLHSLGAS